MSNLSLIELMDVTKKLKIETSRLVSFVKKRFNQVNLEEDFKELKRQFNDYTNDPEDIHVVAGAALAGVDFLLTYNMKDYKIDKIKKDLNILTLTPGNFLQYLRSIQ